MSSNFDKIIGAYKASKDTQKPTTSPTTNAPRSGTKAAPQAQDSAQAEFLDNVTRTRDSGTASLQRIADANKLLNKAQAARYSEDTAIDKELRDALNYFNGAGGQEPYGMIDTLAKIICDITGNRKFQGDIERALIRYAENGLNEPMPLLIAITNDTARLEQLEENHKHTTDKLEYEREANAIAQMKEKLDSLQKRFENVRK